MGTRMSTKRAARVYLMSLSLVSTKCCAHSLRNWNEASKSSMGTILMRKYFMPLRSLMMLALVDEVWLSMSDSPVEDCVCVRRDVLEEEEELIRLDWESADASCWVDEDKDVVDVDDGDCEEGTFIRSNSTRKRRLTREKRDCARVPITSAYRSVTYWLSALSCE